MPNPRGLALDAYDRIERHPTPLTTVSGTRSILDGSPVEQLAFQRQPYLGRPDRRGRLSFPRGRIGEILASAPGCDEQLILHVVGEATADVVLMEMGKLATPTRWASLRMRLTDSSIVNPTTSVP